MSAVTAWTPEELDRIGQAEELHLATRRRDGGLSRYVTMWVVRAGENLYVRSAYGPGNPWYRRARAAGEGSVRASGVERDVTFDSADPAAQGDIDTAYHAKYDRYGPKIVGSVTGPQAHAVTVRLAKAGQHDPLEGN
jgi:hypothetical protein